MRWFAASSFVAVITARLSATCRLLHGYHQYTIRHYVVTITLVTLVNGRHRDGLLHRMLTVAIRQQVTGG